MLPELSWTKAAVVGVVAVLGLLITGGCGPPPHAAPSRSASDASASPARSQQATKAAIAAHFGAKPSAHHRRSSFYADLVAVGRNHVRLEFKAAGYPPTLYVLDGQR